MAAATLRPLADRRLKKLRSYAPINRKKCQNLRTDKPIVQMIFDKFDDNNDGTLNLSELKLLCYDYGYYLTDEEAAETTKSLDTNEDKTISYDEFISWWGKQEKFHHLSMDNNELALRKLLVEVFQTVDKNNSGSIELDEFLMFYTNMRRVVPQLKGIPRKELWSEIDANANGSIDFNELVVYLMAIGVVTAAFK